jgi:ATP-dependent DNA helicase RecQ
MKKQGCTAISQEDGRVFLTKHNSGNLYTPIINQLKHNGIEGTVCVMTNTNDEAVQMAGLLHKEGFRTKLIQSGGSFRLADLAEIRYFLKQIDKRPSTPIISDDAWEDAKVKTLLTYAQSNLQEYLQGFFHAFESTNRVKYRSDLGDFVFESNIEDFCFADKKTVLVSTIHKTKGREFDTVYMMLARNEDETAENIRKLYVGMTRARKSLYIHTCAAIFDGIRHENVEYVEDNTPYSAPNDISVQLTHRDVYLDFFKDKKGKILSLRSGQPLWFKDNGFYSEAGDCVAVLSAKKRNELQEFYRQGFTVYAAEVAFVAAWRGENDTVESAVMLPKMHLRR